MGMTMHGRRTVGIVVGLGLLSLACGGLLSGIPGTPGATSNTPQGAPGAAPTGEPPLAATGESGSPELPTTGRLAVVGTDGNLYVLQADTEPFAITMDVVPSDDSRGGRICAHPTWSPDGWLSYACTEQIDDSTRLDVFAARPGEGDPFQILSVRDASYIYGYWSPTECNAGTRCGRFAFLVGDTQSLALHLAQVSNGTPSASSEKVVGRSPGRFYYSWAPDGDSMLWFRDGVELSIYDVSSATILETLPDTPGIFQAPAWSPAGQRLLFTRVEDGANRMTIADGDERIDVGKPVTEPVFFSWSPDGQRIAYAVGGFPLSPIIVVDANGAESLRLTQVEDIFTFFWSPDSTRLAVVALEERVSPGPQARLSGTRARPPLQTDAPRLVSVWYAIDVETGEATRLSEFYPTREQLYILQFFDQYAQSHRLWSPDGRYIVFAEQPPGEDSPLIRLLDTLSPTEPPITLMEGRQAVFSFEE